MPFSANSDTLWRPRRIWLQFLAPDCPEVLPHANELLGDIPNYTNIPPTAQISEVRMPLAEAALGT